MVSTQQMVKEFHDTFGERTPRKPTLPDIGVIALRMDLIQEEFDELSDALVAGSMEDTADALADLIYVVYGTALVCGINADDIVREVHAANMRKLGPDGKPIYREDGKFLKPDGWIEPDIERALAEQGAW